MQVGLRSEKGSSRAVNQDRLLATCVPGEAGICILAVADGMGGHQSGEVAADVATRTVVQSLVKSVDLGEFQLSPEKAIVSAFREANSQVEKESRSQPAQRGMGTTLTVATVWGRRVTIGHVGDTRALVFRGGHLSKLTSDHSLVGELLRKNSLSEEEAMRHPQRNMLTRALGLEQTVDVDVIDQDLEGGFTLLIASDGVTGVIKSGELEQLLRDAPASAQLLADAIVQAAVARGGHDDATCVVGIFE